VALDVVVALVALDIVIGRPRVGVAAVALDVVVALVALDIVIGRPRVGVAAVALDILVIDRTRLLRRHVVLLSA
jgi:hypothetical protein